MTVPGVLEAAVIGTLNGDGLVRTALFVVPRNESYNEQQLAEVIQIHLINRLSIYKCPRVIRFIKSLPLTSTGKVQKFLVRQLMETREPKGEESNQDYKC